MRAAAIIPARGGSKGVPGKNLRQIGGVPLVGRTTSAAAAAARISSVYVSSDDDAILAAGARYGAAPIRRPADLSSDTASSEDAILHAITELERGGDDAEIIVFLQCTSPFTTSDEIDAVVAAFDDPAINAAFTASEDHGFLWRVDETGAARGVNHDETTPRQRRQDLPSQYLENGAVYAFRKSVFVKKRTRFCPPIVLIKSNAPKVEIDTEEDLALCRRLATVQPLSHDLQRRLSKIKIFITDFDGVHTDDRVIVWEDGREGVMCSRADGMGVERLRKSGMRVVIVSKETNKVVAARAAKMNVEVFHGQENKVSIVDRLLAEAGVEWGELAFMGNDVNDIACMEKAGFAIAPADARAEAKAAASWITAALGGKGAVREAAELLLRVRLEDS